MRWPFSTVEMVSRSASTSSLSCLAVTASLTALAEVGVTRMAKTSSPTTVIR